MVTRGIVAVVCGVVGVVWLGQGLGYIEGSFMTDVKGWAVAGVVLIALAVVMVVRMVRDLRGPTTGP